VAAVRGVEFTAEFSGILIPRQVQDAVQALHDVAEWLGYFGWSDYLRDVSMLKRRIFDRVREAR
jgi:hypothetical protein